VQSPFEDSILRSLRRISRAIDIHSRALVRNHQLTSPQLVCLREIRRDGETTPSALARRISLSQATVTGILDRLAARGLISRTRSETDRRRVLLRLTPEGEQLAREAPSPLQQHFVEHLSALPEGAQRNIDDVLQQVVSMMEADGLDAAAVLAPGAELTTIDAAPLDD
jgi:DNA-binding MarR family transcriptional regulator